MRSIRSCEVGISARQQQPGRSVRFRAPRAGRGSLLRATYVLRYVIYVLRSRDYFLLLHKGNKSKCALPNNHSLVLLGSIRLDGGIQHSQSHWSHIKDDDKPDDDEDDREFPHLQRQAQVECVDDCSGKIQSVLVTSKRETHTDVVRDRIGLAAGLEGKRIVFGRDLEQDGLLVVSLVVVNHNLFGIVESALRLTVLAALWNMDRCQREIGRILSRFKSQ